MEIDAIHVLFGKYHREILAFLLLRPGQGFHVRELERITGLPAGTLNRQLKRLDAAELLTAARSGNQIKYQANRSHPFFEELAGIFRKASGSEMTRDVVRPAIINPICRRHNVKRLSVFGSLARGVGTAHSDIDFMVEFEKDKVPTLAGLSALKDDLEASCGRRVDLATPSMLNNPHRRKAIEKDMEVIYERKGSRAPLGNARSGT